MSHVPQIKVPATYIRGGTSKGVFFRLQDLPEAARVPGKARDALLLRGSGQILKTEEHAFAGAAADVGGGNLDLRYVCHVLS